jgi:hypothetical protein
MLFRLFFNLIENEISHSLSSTGFKRIQAITLTDVGLYVPKEFANYSKTKLKNRTRFFPQLIHTCFGYINKVRINNLKSMKLMNMQNPHNNAYHFYFLYFLN